MFSINYIRGVVINPTIDPAINRNKFFENFIGLIIILDNIINNIDCMD
ncbi:hypothetical protein NADRNF5_1497 [Nitrosopumilus adriaticus]|uniref:Uncharacterized protein n=1 Tax=Nitrosopumilus adriaticus TaxID=1580092 RepID=A0A0D5C3N4_9ARCH|nr:hypothetical protein NADRNF5_1497 [Nitrosopumilus adriaticus]